MPSSAYSSTPLARKLGIKSGFHILLHAQPEHYFELFSDWPEGVEIMNEVKPESADFIHLFCLSQEELTQHLPTYQSALKKNGSLWVSWPKGKSSIPTDLKRDWIREYILAAGLVDVKVASVDEDWSGLKFVYRVEDRK